MLAADEIVCDSFAGGGGASTGISWALGRSPDVAINHDPEAVALHTANHPDTLHYCQNVWQVDPKDVVRQLGGRPVGLAWFSPDCKHFSKAKGGKPVEKRIRDLAWVVVLWAERVRPRVIMLENVEEFQTWGPLGEDGMPCAVQRGATFKKWVGRLRQLGYRVEWRELRACDYGAPTIRKRLFLIARCDGQRIVWPEPTHGPGRARPYRTAAEVIDWSIPVPSIFDRDRPLAENTMRRVANGVRRFVLDHPAPFIVPVTHHGDGRVHGTDEPLRTVTTAPRGEFALVAPYLVPRYGERDGQAPRTYPLDQPAPTIVPTGNGGSLVAPVLVGCGGRAGQSRPRAGDEPLATTTAKADTCLAAVFLGRQFGKSVGGEAEEPVGTITAGGGGKTQVVAAYMAQHNGGMVGHEMGEPLSTICGKGANQALVASFMAQHNGDRIGREADAPISTIVHRGTQQQVVTALLSHQYGSNSNGGEGDPRQPARTVTAAGQHHALITAELGDDARADQVSAFLIKYFGSAEHGQDCRDPLHTVTAKPRFGLVTVQGVQYRIVDIGMRMLTPRELYRAQGFPDSYLIEVDLDGRPLTKTAQVRMCGNSVCPQMSAALVRANFAAAEAAVEVAA